MFLQAQSLDFSPLSVLLRTSCQLPLFSPVWLNWTSSGECSTCFLQKQLRSRVTGRALRPASATETWRFPEEPVSTPEWAHTTLRGLNACELPRTCPKA